MIYGERITMPCMRSRQGVRILLLGLAVLLCVGSSALPVASPPVVPPTGVSPKRVFDRSIRGFDFGNTLWFDYTRAAFEANHPVGMDSDRRQTRGEVRLVNGRDENGPWGPYAITEPVFADADGDGDEDAFVGLRIEGNGANVIYYIWRWEDQHAVQVSYPVLEFSRCGAAPVSIAALQIGFEIKTKLKRVRAPCAEDGSIPASMRVTERDGYPLQVGPLAGATDFCLRDSMIKARYQRRFSVEARVAREWAAPVAATIKPGDEIMFVADALGRALTLDGWSLVLVRQGSQQICGWVSDLDPENATGIYDG